MALKNQILAMLEQSRGEPLSGTALAREFGVSRNAVWKAVNALKAEGHIIGTAGKQGYQLAEDSDELTAEGIRACMIGFENIKILTYKQVASTNDEAKKFCVVNSGERAVFIAEKQTAGRGRFGRSFYSPESGLYLSAVTHPNRTIERSVVYTAAAAVAAVRAITKVCGAEPKIKWINDLYLDCRKICGILTEAVTDFETGEVRSMITGIGVNLSTENFPDELREKAAGLGRGVRRNQLAAQIICELYQLSELEPSAFMEEYRRDCFLIGREIVFFDGEKELRARVADIGAGCELELDIDGEKRSYIHGEIRKIIGEDIKI